MVDRSPALPGDVEGPDNAASLVLHAEAVAVDKRTQRMLVRAVRSTTLRQEHVTADLESIQVVVERTPMHRIVDEIPPVRVEDDVTILSVVKEELVLVRRLVVTEEVRLRTVRSTSNYVETVELREQDVCLTRTPIED